MYLLSLIMGGMLLVTVPSEKVLSRDLRPESRSFLRHRRSRHAMNVPINARMEPSPTLTPTTRRVSTNNKGEIYLQLIQNRYP